MTTVHLPKKWIDFLVHQPETGMGYQRVDIRFKSKREIRNATVFNAEIVELPEELAGEEIDALIVHARRESKS